MYLALIRVVDRINKCVSKMVIMPNRIDCERGILFINNI